MNLTRVNIILLVVLFGYSCENKEDATSNLETNLSPLIIKLKTDGYDENVVSKNKIITSSNAGNDTSTTGVKIIIEGRKACRVDTIKPELTSITNPFPDTIKIKDRIVFLEGNEVELIKTKSNKLDYKRLTYVADSVSEDQYRLENQSNKLIDPDQDNSTDMNISLLGTDQGLSSIYVKTIIEDKRKNKWVGYIEGGGLTKSDGTFLTYYDVSGGKEERYDVNCLFEDSKGNIWIGTNECGLICYDGFNFISYWINDLKEANVISSICQDRNGNLIIGTEVGMIRYDGANFDYLIDASETNEKKVSNLLLDSDGKVWVCRSNGALHQIVQDSIVKFSLNINNKVISIFEDTKGNIWLGLDKSTVVKYDGKKGHAFELDKSLLINVTSFNEDDKGNVWIGTFGFGVYVYNGKSFKVYNKNNGLNTNYIYTIHIGSDLNVWLGTFAGGINKVNLSSFGNFELFGLGSDKMIWRIFEDSQENKWFGMVGDGVFCLKDQTLLKYGVPQGLLVPTIVCFLEDTEKNIWMGSPGGGLYMLDPQRFYRYTPYNGFPISNITCILQDKKGDIWFGSQEQGLVRYDGEYFTHFSTNEGFPSNTVWDMLQDSQGNIWFATMGGGLVKYDGEAFVVYTEKEGLSSATLFSIIEDTKGNIWFTSEKGVTKFDGVNWEHYTKSHGLNDNITLSILEVKKDHFWVATEAGINHLVVKDEGTKIGSFDKSDGLKEVDFFIDGMYQDANDKLWFNGSRGTEILDLSYQKGEQDLPLAKLKLIEVNGVRVNHSDYEYDSIEKYSGLPINLNLTYYQNNIVFNYAATYWSGKHKVRYSYFLEGYSNSWSKVDDEIKTGFTNLPPGDYCFKVRGSNNYNSWGAVSKFYFTISPPWWSTIWSKIGICILLVLLIYLIVKIRTRKLELSEQKLKAEIALATEDILSQKIEIEKQHTEIMDSISYAKRIQSAILSPPSIVKEYLSQSLIVYIPKDVVAGDFYWMHRVEDKILFAVADCTGHGVPGAMISVVCSHGLNRSIREYNLSKPAEILDKTREIVSEEFEKSVENVNDGMDIALCLLGKNYIEYAGAYNPLWIVRDEEIIEIKGDKQPIGKFDNYLPYTPHKLELKEGDIIYIFSDGLVDQFGGERGKKMKPKGLRALLLKIRQLPMLEQREAIIEAFYEWKGDEEQVDDICIIGVKIDDDHLMNFS